MKIDTLAHVKNQLSAVVESLGGEPLFITRNGKIAAVLQACSDDQVEDYLLRNSRRFQRLIESRRQEAQQGRVLPFDPARYHQDDDGSSRVRVAREKRAKYRTSRKRREKT